MGREAKIKRQRRVLRQAVRYMWEGWWDEIAKQSLWYRLGLAIEIVTLFEYRRNKRREKKIRDGDVRLVPKWQRQHRKHKKNLRGKR